KKRSKLTRLLVVADEINLEIRRNCEKLVFVRTRPQNWKGLSYWRRAASSSMNTQRVWHTSTLLLSGQGTDYRRRGQWFLAPGNCGDIPVERPPKRRAHCFLVGAPFFSAKSGLLFPQNFFSSFPLSVI